MAKTVHSHVIVALDFATGDEAQRLLHKLQDTEYTHVWVKVGLQLFLSEGSNFVRYMLSKGPNGYKIMLDLKFHDIPRIVYGAVETAARMGASMVTVHAGGGQRMLEAAAEAGHRFNIRTLAVTVLTSLDNSDLFQLTGRGLSEQVLTLAELAKKAGVDGLVCSPREAALLRHRLPGKLLVVPGIRSIADSSDQLRTGTATQARAAGADYIVVGHPIRTASDPAAAFDLISGEMHPQ